MTLKETCAVSTLKKLNVNGNDLTVLRTLEVGGLKTWVTDDLVLEAKLLLQEYREDERVEEGDILDRAVIKLIVYNKKNDCTKDYIVDVSLADYRTDNYDVIVRLGNKTLIHTIYDSNGGIIEGDDREYEEIGEDVTSMIESILFSYDPDEKLSKTVMLGLINPF